MPSMRLRILNAYIYANDHCGNTWYMLDMTYTATQPKNKTLAIMSIQHTASPNVFVPLANALLMVVEPIATAANKIAAAINIHIMITSDKPVSILLAPFRF
jgi:hypothetical protein